jgi:hypothetical protein
VIVRILGEGQYDLSDEAVSALNDLDARVESAIEAGDDGGFHEALAALLDGVRTAGVPTRRCTRCATCSAATGSSRADLERSGRLVAWHARGS